MNKKFFIIPGFKKQASDQQYQWLVSYVKSKGWTPVIVPMRWNYQTLSQNAEDFKNFYHKHKGTENQILGFSYGAVITLMVSGELKPCQIYLCSLSPDFKEDKEKMPLWLKKYIGKRRLQDVATRSGIELAKKLNVPTKVFYGEMEGKEYPGIKKRAEETVRYAKNATLVMVPKAPHRIDALEYVEVLKGNLEV